MFKNSDKEQGGSHSGFHTFLYQAVRHMTTKTNAKKKPVQGSVHPWSELSKATSFSISELRVLQEHHATLFRFCVDPASAETETATRVDDAAETLSFEPGDANAARTSSSLELPFEQYCHCLHSLVEHGSAAQVFEYLFQTYARESEHGISRAELFQLLQDHYKPSGTRSSDNTTSTSTGVAVSSMDARHFERLYTWLKRHLTVYDRARSGFLPLCVAIEMLQTHPDALYKLQFQVTPFITKLDENNKQYQAKAQAAAIS